MRTKKRLPADAAIAWIPVCLVMIGLTIGCNGQPTPRKAFTHVSLVPMTGSGMAFDDQAVLVEGDRIVAIGGSDTLSVPRGTLEIDGRGAYLMPGLADMHVHTRQDWEDPGAWPVHPLSLYLANGVTTIRDLGPDGTPLAYALQWRDEIREGTRSGPAIYASGELLFASPLEDPAGIVRRNQADGFHFLKLYSYLSPADFSEAMATARGLGLYTTGHIPYAVGLQGVLDEGMDELAHVEELLAEFIGFERTPGLTPEKWLPYIVQTAMSEWDLDAADFQASFEAANREKLMKIAEQLRRADVPVCTTMVIDDVVQGKLFSLEAFLARTENQYLPTSYLESLRQGEEKHQIQFRGMEMIAEIKYAIDRWVLAGLHGADVLLLLGTDSGTGGMGIVPGFSIHDELRLLVENGLTEYEAIATGTVNAARVVHRMTGEGDFGTIEVGKRADLILVRANPLDDISTIRDPLGVMAAGRWYPRERLAELVEGASLPPSGKE